MLKFTLQWWSKLLACKTKIFKFKANDNINWYNICLGNVSEDFTKQEQSAISLNGTVYDLLTLVQLKKTLLIFTNI